RLHAANARMDPFYLDVRDHKRMLLFTAGPFTPQIEESASLPQDRSDDSAFREPQAANDWRARRSRPAGRIASRSDHRPGLHLDPFELFDDVDDAPEMKAEKHDRRREHEADEACDPSPSEPPSPLCAV